MPPQQWMGHLRVSERQGEFAVWPPSFLAVWGENDAICAPINSVKWWEGKELGWPGFAAIEQRISDLYSPPLKGDWTDSGEVECRGNTILPEPRGRAVWHNAPREKHVDKYGRKCGRIPYSFQNVPFWTAQMRLFTKVRADRRGSTWFETWSGDLKRLDSPLFSGWIFDVARNSSWIETVKKLMYSNHLFNLLKFAWHVVDSKVNLAKRPQIKPQIASPSFQGASKDSHRIGECAIHVKPRITVTRQVFAVTFYP